jgi:hypothetical protein
MQQTTHRKHGGLGCVPVKRSSITQVFAVDRPAESAQQAVASGSSSRSRGLFVQPVLAPPPLMLSQPLVDNLVY